MKKIIILLILTLCFSCGKKGALRYQGERKQPNFDKVFDEI